SPAMLPADVQKLGPKRKTLKEEMESKEAKAATQQPLPPSGLQNAGKIGLFGKSRTLAEELEEEAKNPTASRPEFVAPPKVEPVGKPKSEERDARNRGSNRDPRTNRENRGSRQDEKSDGGRQDRERRNPRNPDQDHRRRPESAQVPIAKRPLPEPTELIFDSELEEIPPVTWRSREGTAKPALFREPRQEWSRQPEAPSTTPVSPEDQPQDEEGRLVVLHWRDSAPATGSRPKDSRPKEEDQDSNIGLGQGDEESSEPQQSSFSARKNKAKSRRERGFGRDESGESTNRSEVTEPPVKAAPAEPQKPVRPRRLPIVPPEDAAQVVVHDGHVCLIRDQKVYAPLFFAVDPSDPARVAGVQEQLRLAHEHGVEIIVCPLNLIVDPDRTGEAIAACRNRLETVLAAHPAAQVVFRLDFVPGDGWFQSYPDARYYDAKGRQAEPSLSDDSYWQTAQTCLELVSKGVMGFEQVGHVMGFHLGSGDWFYADTEGYDTSAAARTQFRTWLRHRYRNDSVSLRAAWFDGGVTFESVEVPEFGAAAAKGDEFVRFGRKARKWVDYHLFLSDQVVDRIGQLAYCLKETSGGRFLVGTSYGYTFEWSHPASGHLSLGKLLRCPDIDFISAPPSYKSREPGGSAAFPSPVDSFALNGKLFISEEDFRTAIGGRVEEEDHNPMMKTPQALESAHWRGAGAALAHKGGVCWCDTFGNGWLNSRGIWQRAEIIKQSLLQRMAKKPESPDVAVFVDERSLALLVDDRAFSALVQNVRESILRSGLSAGFYLLSDLAHRENFPESKLYVFMNAWDIRPEVRAAIKSRLQRDEKVLFWLYAAGLFEGGRDSLERVREATGIALRPQPFNSPSGTSILNSRDPLCRPLPESLLSQGGQLEPSYFAIPEEAVVLGEYSQTGLPSYVVRKFANEGQGGWTSVFLGEPVVTPGLFRSLAERTDAHVWNFGDDVVHVCPPYLTLHSSSYGAKTLMLPDKWVAYSLTTQEWMPIEANSIRFTTLDGLTHSFLIGPIGEIQSILNADIPSLTKIRGPIIREENTMHWDAIKFDVPIMKLDEWVEETWSDEMADDLLLKPSMLDIDSEALMATEDTAPSGHARSTGRRRRRGKRGKGGDDVGHPRRERDNQDSEQFGDSGINVMFRKRV
nr:hypothetical protein [Fimbriimonadaceae bacterium]